jgi:PAS domain S-box-containing protein
VGTTVLHIDDDQASSALIQRALSRISPDITFRWAEEGSEALDILTASHIDCVISDYQMPGMDGLELMKRARELGIDVPFIFVTGQGSEDIARTTLKMGAFDYFTKDIDFAHFHRIANSIEQAVKVREAEHERRKAEADLIESERRFRMLYERVPVGYQSLDEDGCFVEVNQAWLDILGYTREQVMGHWFGEFLCPGFSQDNFAKSFPLFKNVGEVHGVEFEMMRSNGSTIHVVFEGRVGYDGQGNFKQTHCVLSDFTSRRNYEKKLERLNSELSEKNRELEQLVYITSHDLRAPLTNIAGFMGEMKRGIDRLVNDMDASPLDNVYKARQKALLESVFTEPYNFIHKGINKMDRLITSLLKYSRAGSMPPESMPLNMTELVSNAATNFMYHLQQADAVIDIGELPPAFGDEALVEQVISNLVDNAIKYLDPERPGRVRISGTVQAGNSVYCVEDNGRGISRGLADKIFEIFFREDRSAAQGEGLGLPMVRKMLTSMGGRIWVESKKDVGSKFFFSLPGQGVKQGCRRP